MQLIIIRLLGFPVLKIMCNQTMSMDAVNGRLYWLDVVIN